LQWRRDSELAWRQRTQYHRLWPPGVLEYLAVATAHCGMGGGGVSRQAVLATKCWYGDVREGIAGCDGLLAELKPAGVVLWVGGSTLGKPFSLTNHFESMC
jgi:hypothetical protein